MNHWHTFEQETRNVPGLGEVILRYQRHYDDIPIKDNLIVIEDKEEQERIEQETKEDLEHNPFAWCVLKVTAHLRDLPGIKGKDALGGVNILDEWARQEHGGTEEAAVYHAKEYDMPHKAIFDLARKIKDAQDNLEGVDPTETLK